MNKGYQPPVYDSTHYNFGGGQLGDQPIVPSGQWDAWLPDPEIQTVNGVEPYACVSFATLNCVETLIRQEFGDAFNYSDRWLAWRSGTQAKRGNDPHTVAETLRTRGDVLESAWPIDAHVQDFNSFYTTPPSWTGLLALDFIDEFSYGHEWVPGNPASMMEALKYSPLNGAVYAWDVDPITGYFIRPPGAVSEHDVMVYGFEEGKYWKIYDSVSYEKKELAWNFGFDAVKRHTIHRQIVNKGAWELFKRFINNLIRL